MSNIFTSGVATALITPFTKDGIDYTGLSNLIEFQIDNGIDALLICGTTGEPATMTNDEYRAVIEFAIAQINHRLPVIVGTGTNCTATSVEKSVLAQQLGADMLLVVTPYYNKCTQKGLVAHYAAIDAAVNIPIIAYSVPGRTGVNITPDTAYELSCLDNVIGIKDAAGNLQTTADTAVKVRGTDFIIYSGDDELCIPMMSVGAKGLISVCSNAMPLLIADMVHSYLNGKHEYALNLYLQYKKFFGALFVEPNPIPIKYVCSQLGLCDNILRMPLTPIESGNIAGLQPFLDEMLK